MPKKQKGKDQADAEEFQTVTKASSGSLRVSKASSSGAAQTLLSSGLSAFGSRFSFEGVPGLSGFVTETRDPSDVADDEIQFCFKALSRKRDLTTKLKAFKQLEELFQPEKRTNEDLEKVLPAFVTHLNRLAMDNERRVREALFQCFGLLVSRLKKQLAPQLKRVFPTWWICQYDPCREVAKAATTAFANGFPQESKRPEVLKYCRTEYLAQVTDYLSQTPQTMSDMKVYSEEDADSRYDRVLQATLTSLASYAQLSLDNEELFFDTGVLGVNGLVWKFSNSKRSAIRKGLYALCHTLTAKVTFPDSVLPCIAKVVLYSANDTEKSNHRALWEAILHLIKLYPACWEHVDARKVWNGIFDTLRKGCHGSGAVVYPYLLPILTCLPPSVCTLAEKSKGKKDDSVSTSSSSSSSSSSASASSEPVDSSKSNKKKQPKEIKEETKHINESGDVTVPDVPISGSNPTVAFYKTFLESLWRGRQSARTDAVIDAAPLKYDAIITAFWECAVFIISRNWINDIDVSRSIVHSVLLPALQNEFQTKAEQNMPDFFFIQANRSLAGILRTLAQEEEGTQLWQAIESLSVQAIQGSDSGDQCRHVSLLLRAENLHDLAPCIDVVRTVFQRSYKSFATSLNPPPLNLCVDLALQYGFAVVVSRCEGGPTGFVADALVPTLKVLCQRSQQGSEPIEVVTTFAPFLSSALSTIEEKGQTQLWDDILSAVESASPEKGIMTTTFRVLVVALLPHHPEVWGHPALDAMMALQAEKFMLCGLGDLSNYVHVLQACLDLHDESKLILSPTYTSTIVSSLLDALLSFFRLQTNSKDIEAVKQLFLKEHEINADMLPSIFPILSKVVQQPKLFGLLAADSPTLTSEKDELIKAAFWLQESEFGALAQSAVEFFNSLDGDLLPLTLLQQLAIDLHAQLNNQPESFARDQKVARAWALRAVELIGSVKAAQQQLLDTLLPSQITLNAILADFVKTPSQDLVLRTECLQHCVYELLVLVGSGVLFLGASLGSSDTPAQEAPAEPASVPESPNNETPQSGRSWLMAGLLCLEAELACWTIQDDPFQFTVQVHHCITERVLPGALMQQVFEDTLQLAKTGPSSACTVLTELLERAHVDVMTFVKEALLSGQYLEQASACLDTFLSAADVPLTLEMLSFIVSQVEGVSAKRDAESDSTKATFWLNAGSAYFEALSRNSQKVAHLSEQTFDHILQKLPQLSLEPSPSRARLASAVLHLGPDVNRSLADMVTSELASELLNWVTSSFTAAASFTPPPLVPSQFFSLQSSVQLLSALGTTDISPVIPSILDFFTSPVFFGLGVFRSLDMLTGLARVVSAYFLEANESRQAVLYEYLALEEKAEEDPSLISFTPFAPPRRRSLWTSLCSLLSHPCAALALCASQLLGQGVRSRVVRVVLKEPDSLPQVEGDDDPQKELARQSLRARWDQERQDSHLDALLPSAVIRLTRSYIQRKVWSSLHLRGYFLLWNVLLESISIPASKSEELDKKAVIVRFLRDSQIVSLVCTELFEHISVSLSEESLIEEQNLGKERLKTGRTALTEDICEPNRPLAGLHVFKFMTRLRQLRKARVLLDEDNDEEDEESTAQGEECLFFGRLAFRVYLATLFAVPALSRAWFTNAPRSLGNAISQWTSKHISPLLIETELSTAVKPKEPAVRIHLAEAGEDLEEKEDKQDEGSDAEFKISCNLAAAEVVARYKLGEISLGVVIRLAKSHPLVSATVELIDTVKIQEMRAKRWQLTIASTLASQNGSIRDAIMAWRRNVEKHFQGVEECPICYSVIDNNRSLPRMACRTCNNKFHPSCLYTWFNTSGNSKCPLCRKLF